MRLTTEQAVKALATPEQGVKVYTDDAITGFGVRCSQGGSKSYILTLPGAARSRVTIGKVGVVGLADARTVAKRMLAEEALGKHRAKRQTFAEAVETFIETRKQRNRPKTYLETERLLKREFRPLHAMNLEDIRAHHITDITDALSKKGLQSTAAHAHTAAHTVLRFCSQRHYIAFNPIADLEKPPLPKSRERVLSDDELKAVWAAADATKGSFGIIVKLLILTGQRRGEIASLKAEWCSLPPSKDGKFALPPAPLAVGGENTDCEVNTALTSGLPPHRFHGVSEKKDGRCAQCTITLPSEITKNRRAHTFPLGPLSLILLRTLLDLFPTKKLLFEARGTGKSPKPFNGWSKAKAQLDEKVEELFADASKKAEPWTLHDLRRTYATNLQRLGIRLEVIEALLNHVSGTRAGIVGVYNRHRYEQEMRNAVATYDEWFERTIMRRNEAK